MKTLNITFTEAEYEKLKKAKGIRNSNRSWHNFILTFAKGISVKHNKAENGGK